MRLMKSSWVLKNKIKKSILFLGYDNKQTILIDDLIKKDCNVFWFNNKKSHKTNVFKRSDLPPGFKFKDTAIIVQEDATTLIPTDCELYVDDQLNLVIRTS